MKCSGRFPNMGAALLLSVTRLFRDMKETELPSVHQPVTLKHLTRPRHSTQTTTIKPYACGFITFVQRAKKRTNKPTLHFTLGAEQPGMCHRSAADTSRQRKRKLAVRPSTCPNMQDVLRERGVCVRHKPVGNHRYEHLREQQRLDGQHPR